MQTFHLSELTRGPIVAVANHEPSIEVLRTKYLTDVEALAVLNQLAREPELHRQYADSYAYEFFVVRRTR